MKRNVFEMGAKIDDSWSSDNKIKATKRDDKQIKPPNKHLLSLVKEKRRGKIVTIAKSFYISKSDFQTLLQSLKKSLGAGGTIKDDGLEIQGDLGVKLREKLEDMGYRFK